MKNLSMLTPAETMMIVHETGAARKELLKVTFMDLLLKQVLRSVEEVSKASRHDPERTLTYITRGKNFEQYKPLDHEGVFLSGFRNKWNKLLFRNVVTIGFENSRSTRKYHSVLSGGPALSPHFTKSFFYLLNGKLLLTNQGYT